VLLLEPVSGKWNDVRGLIPKLWVGGLFGGSFSAIFIWTRVQIARMPCFESNTCYNGTVVDFDLGNIFKNFVSALPGQGLEAILSPDGAGISRFLLAVGSVATLALILSLMAHYFKLRLHLPDHSADQGHEFGALLKLTSLMVFLALVSAIITGITARAAERLVDPLTPYRSGPSIALALSVAAIALLIISMRFFDKNILVKKSMLVIAASLVIMFSSSNFAMNIQQTRIQAQNPVNILIQAIHTEVALGAPGDQALLRRCLLLEDAKTLLGEQAEIRFIPGAEKAFNLYWGTDFCSKEQHKVVDLVNTDG
jgi:prepilin signal peptidase PulO-like enzyme (type II secretory pathway)